MLVLVNLLAQCGDLVSLLFQLSLYFLYTLRSGLPFCCCCVADAGGIDCLENDTVVVIIKMSFCLGLPQKREIQ